MWASLCCKNMAWSDFTNYVTSLASGRFIVPFEGLTLVCPWVDSAWVYLWLSKWFPFCDPRVSFEGTNLSLDGFPPFPCLPKEVQGTSKLFLLEDCNFEGLSSLSANYFPLSFLPPIKKIFFLGGKSFLCTFMPFFFRGNCSFMLKAHMIFSLSNYKFSPNISFPILASFCISSSLAPFSFSFSF